MIEARQLSKFYRDRKKAEIRALDYDGVAVRDPKCPHSAISYRAESLEAMAGLAGLEVQRVIPGLWADHPGVSVHEQDLLLMVPAIRATATLT